MDPILLAVIHAAILCGLLYAGMHLAYWLINKHRAKKHLELSIDEAVREAEKELDKLFDDHYGST